MIGEMAKKTLNALLETIPIEFSVLDENDKVLAWNKHDSRIFKRSKTVVGRDVRNCHPPQSLAKVDAILSEMKAGKRDQAEFWIELKLNDQPEADKILIQYFALRDKERNYLGCLECTQNIQYLQSLKGEKKLLD